MEKLTDWWLINATESTKQGKTRIAQWVRKNGGDIQDIQLANAYEAAAEAYLAANQDENEPAFEYDLHAYADRIEEVCKDADRFLEGKARNAFRDFLFEDIEKYGRNRAVMGFLKTTARRFVHVDDEEEDD